VVAGLLGSVAWRCEFARNIAPRNLALFHRKDRLTRISIQHIEKLGFVALYDRWNVFSVVLQGCEQRWRVSLPFRYYFSRCEWSGSKP
jgi:predicted membrane chloride channel (bestrophin family)